MPTTISPLARFEAGLNAPPNPVAALKEGLIGKGTCIPGPFGPREIIYADYIASGRPLRQVEKFIFEDVLPFYANSHTEDSYCGAVMTALRAEARAVIADICGANPRDHAVIFSGAGATSALNQIVHLFAIRDTIAKGQPVHVITGPYEHHSNLLPWRESGAEVIEIAEAAEGGPDMAMLDAELARCAASGLTIASISAASNVTGICADVPAITRLVKSHGALMVWDYAGGGPYLPIAMDNDIDAIALSPHKFIGGPAASGVLLLRRDAVRTQIPSRPGGGTVTFVNQHAHDYHALLEEREEGGTPNVIGDIRAALAMIVKRVIGEAWMEARNKALTARALAAWHDVPGINLLASDKTDRLPFLSFVPGNGWDHRAFTRALSDRYGIQARAGCACAGPYVHRLLEIGDTKSETLRREILNGDESHKPGFVRINLSVLMEDATVDVILAAVAELAGQHVEKAA